MCIPYDRKTMEMNGVDQYRRKTHSSEPFFIALASTTTSTSTTPTTTTATTDTGTSSTTTAIHVIIIVIIIVIMAVVKYEVDHSTTSPVDNSLEEIYYIDSQYCTTSQVDNSQ